MKLNAEFLDKVTPGIRRCWEIVGGAIEAAAQETGDRLTNSMAIEASIESCHLTAYGHKETDDLISETIRDYNYQKVFTYLVRHIRLA